MEPITPEILITFLQRLGAQAPHPATLYLLGGSALCLLGNPRTTTDVDYDLEASEGVTNELNALVAKLSEEMELELEQVVLREFVPLPPQARQRRKWVGQFGLLEVYVHDPYSIALSKIARGFESDMSDVLFLLQAQLIELSELERLFQAVLPDARQADILPSEFLAYFNEVKRRWIAR